MGGQRRCWCGSVDLEMFSPDYFVCSDCRTLVAAVMPGPEIAQVEDEEHDFYGRRYWFEYQERDLGNPDITVRARSDLPERCVHWLRTVLRYRLPPARALDVGCGPGAFVMLLGRAGYEAKGLELSPWVVEFARKTFDVPVLLGPIEEQSLAPGSIDIVTMMDVLEHLRDPVATLDAVRSAMADDGILVIQTPSVPPDLSMDEMVAANHPFLPLMRERGHLFLFGRAGLRSLLERVGIPHIHFESAYFAAYDMFVVASRRPLDASNPLALAQALCVTPDSRIVQALLDLDEPMRELQARYEDVERDRVARLTALNEQATRLMGAEGERNDLLAEVDSLKKYFADSEADRAARLTIIRRQSEQLTAAEREGAARLALIEQLSEQLVASEKDRADRLAVIQELSRHLAASEKDRADRLAVIQELGERLAVAERDRSDRQAMIQELSAQLRIAEADRAARLVVIEEQGRRVDEIERDRNALKAELTSLRFRRVRVIGRRLIQRLRTLLAL